MTVPGVGPVVALTYRATVDVPARFITISATQSQPCLRTGRANLSCGLRKLQAPPEQSTLSA
jgi:predicted ATPase with chaperone activity